MLRTHAFSVLGASSRLRKRPLSIPGARRPEQCGSGICLKQHACLVFVFMICFCLVKNRSAKRPSQIACPADILRIVSTFLQPSRQTMADHSPCLACLTLTTIGLQWFQHYFLHQVCRCNASRNGTRTWTSHTLHYTTLEPSKK